MATYYEICGSNQVGPFDVEYAWRTEDSKLRDLFDDDDADLAEMQEKIDTGAATFFMVRLRVRLKNVLLSEEWIGGLYYETDPETAIESGLDGLKESFTLRAIKLAQHVLQGLVEKAPEALATLDEY